MQQYYLQVLNSDWDWLRGRAYGWQFGERGILLALCELYDVQKGVEIGAGDGVSLPVTLDFMPTLSLFEIDPERQAKLKSLFPSADVYGEFTDQAHITDGACVVIDIDSRDFEIATKILQTKYRPAIICIEHYDREGPYMSTGEGEPSELVPDWLLGMELAIGGFAIQQPWQAMRPYFECKGYKLVALTRCNSIYVRSSDGATT